MAPVAARLVDGRAYYGWVVVAACFLASAVVFGMNYSFGVFLDSLAGSFGASAGRASLVFGVQLFVIYVSAPPMGGLVEWLGPRRGLVLAGLLLGGGMVAGSLAGTIAVLVVTYSLVAGAGMSLAFVIGYATPPQWFQRRRGMATALASTGLGVGLVVISPSAEALVGQFGWRGAFRVLGVALALVLFVAAILIADDPGEVDAPATPEFPDGRPSVGTTWRDQVGVMRDALRTPAFVVLFCGYVLLYGTLYVLLNHVVNFAAGLGIRETGVLSLTVIGGSTTLTRLAVGAVADRLGRIAVFVVCATGMGLALLALPLGRSPAALLAVAAFFGVCYGGTGALMSAVPADLFDDRNLNTLFGLVALSFAVPGLMGPFLAGVGFDRVGTYTPVFLATGLVGLVGVGLVATAAWVQRDAGAGT